MEKTRSWKALSWKVRNKIGKIEVGKFWLKLENWNESTAAKLSNFARSFPTSLGSFQLRSVLSNFAPFFPTSIGSFQFRLALSNFRLSNLKLSNFSFFPTALSNYTYPKKSPKNQTYHQILRIFVWILFPEMTLGDAPKTNFSKFSWILFPKMTLGDAPNFWILFPRFANMG